MLVRGNTHLHLFPRTLADYTITRISSIMTISLFCIVYNSMAAAIEVVAVVLC